MTAALLLVLLSASQPQTPPPALVLGRVLDAGTGRPIPGAIVSLNGSAVPPPASDGSGQPPRVMTNASGQFVVRGLRKGTLVLYASHSGYIDATYGQRRPLGSAQPLQIDDGGRLTDIEMYMWRPGVISGSVLDEAGEPIVNAIVRAARRTVVAGRVRFAGGTERPTDDRGYYRLPGLVPGDYIVSIVSRNASAPASALEGVTGVVNPTNAVAVMLRELGAAGATVAPPGSPMALNVGDQVMTIPPGDTAPVARPDGSLLVYPTLFYPASRTAAQAGVVTVGSGQERSGVDLQLVPVPGVRVSGVVMGPEGPVPHTAVRLMPAFSDRIADPIQAAGTIADGAGNFTFPAVPSGDYVVEVIHLPHPPLDAGEAGRASVIQSGGRTIASAVQPDPTGVAPPPVPGDPTLCANVPLSVGNRGLSGIVVALQPGPRVSGRLEFDGTSDKPTSRQLQDVRIALESVDGAPLPQRLSFETGHPDENGQFITTGVPPGRYLLRVTTTIPGWFFRGALAEGRDLADAPLDLRTDVRNVVLAFTDRPSSIGGRVQGDHGPDGDAVVIAFPTDPEAWIDHGSSQRRLRTTRAAKDGAYTLPSLPPGEYYVVAVKDEFVGDPYEPAFLESLAHAAQQVRLVEGDRKIQDLRTIAIR